MAKVSIIIPVYNSEKYLRKCLDSVCNQTLKEIEIILLNDASTDSSLEIMKHYEKIDSRIKVINMSSNVGPGTLRNIGIREASGEYIGFVDSDDYIELDMFYELYNNINGSDTNIICCNTAKEIFGIDYRSLLFNESKNSGNLKIISLDKETDFLYSESMSCWNKLYRHDFIDKFSFPENLKYEDYPMVTQMLGTANNIFTLERKLYHYRIRPDSISTSDNKSFKLDTLDIFECNKKIQEFYIENGLITVFGETLKDLYFIHSLSKAAQILDITMPLAKKKKLINYFVNLVELEHGDWRNNQFYREKKDYSFIFGPKMDFIEGFILDDSLRMEISSEVVKTKIKELCSK